MRQQVIVTRRADRHADLVDRDFAESFGVEVVDGSLSEVLRQVADNLEALPRGHYTITISEPYE